MDRPKAQEGCGHWGVNGIQDQKQEFGPCLQALVLVLKALLNQHSLNDPSQGGLGGYSLLNMIVAYLRQESHPEGMLNGTKVRVK